MIGPYWPQVIKYKKLNTKYVRIFDSNKFNKLWLIKLLNWHYAVIYVHSEQKIIRLTHFELIWVIVFFKRNEISLMKTKHILLGDLSFCNNFIKVEGQGQRFFRRKYTLQIQNKTEAFLVKSCKISSQLWTLFASLMSLM